MEKNNEADDATPDALPTQGRVLTKAASVYDAVQPFITLGQENRLNRWVAENIDLQTGSRALDVGCGTGLLTAAIADANPTCKVVGIDASRPMIEVARRKRSGPRCSYEQAVAEALPFEAGEFDAATSALFFHHVNREYKARALDELWRVLKPGGLLVIADMDRPYTPMGWFMALAGWIVLRQPEIKENIDGILPGLMEEAGFERIKKIARFSGYISVWSAKKGPECRK